MLENFLKTKGLKKKEFARWIGVSPSYLSRILNGGTVPSSRLLLKIEKQTGGVVKASSFLEEILKQAA